MISEVEADMMIPPSKESSKELRDIIITEPTYIKSFDNSHVYAICKCPVSTDYGIIIDKQYTHPSWYRFKCTKCGLEGEVWG